MRQEALQFIVLENPSRTLLSGSLRIIGIVVMNFPCCAKCNTALNRFNSRFTEPGSRPASKRS